MTAKESASPRLLRRLLDLLTRPDRAPPGSRDQPPTAAPDSACVTIDSDAETGGVARERRVLVDACILVADQSGSEMLREHVTEALEAAGVHAIRVDGEPFDQERHHAVGRVPTEDATRHGVIASTQREGYIDRDAVIRKPEVLVYRHAGR